LFNWFIIALINLIYLFQSLEIYKLTSCDQVFDGMTSQDINEVDSVFALYYKFKKKIIKSISWLSSGRMTRPTCKTREHQHISANMSCIVSLFPTVFSSSFFLIYSIAWSNVPDYIQISISLIIQPFPRNYQSAVKKNSSISCMRLKKCLKLPLFTWQKFLIKIHLPWVSHPSVHSIKIECLSKIKEISINMCIFLSISCFYINILYAILILEIYVRRFYFDDILKLFNLFKLYLTQIAKQCCLKQHNNETHQCIS
jgi:hypothetical protein